MARKARRGATWRPSSPRPSKQLDTLSKQLEAAKSAQTAKVDEKEKLLGYVDDLKKEKERLTREADRVKRVIEQKDALHGGPLHWYSEPMAFLRSLPGIDLMPPTKIQQISLPELTINYNFKEVPRYDRCATCHQGIDRIGYDKDAARSRICPSIPVAPVLDLRGHHGRSSRQGRARRPLPRRQRSAPDQQLRLHDLSRRAGFRHRLHLCVAHARLPQGSRRVGRKSTTGRDFHFWDFPMPPKRFIESSCLKCHQQVTDIPQATKLQAGYQRIVKYGCTGCHAIGGDGSSGPDLTGERQVGPNLSHIAAKNSQGVGTEVDRQSSCVPAGFADAAVLRPDQ